MKKLITTALLSLIGFAGFSQGSPDYGAGMKFNLDQDGKKYVRVISWGQVWAQYNDNVPKDVSETSFSIRRARVLLYSQLNDKFMILTHFGLNSLDANNMTPTGKGESSQLFLHELVLSYNVNKNHVIGGGLHAWNGISRLNNQGTLNIMTLDNNRQSWATLGLADQFTFQLGIFAKGTFGKFQYRVAISEPTTNGLDTRDATDPALANTTIYGGRRVLGSKHAGKTFSGYFEYNLLDLESNFLQYKVGSYLGTKKIFNIGAGFFSHPKGSVVTDAAGNFTGENVNIFAVDAFYDAPLGENKGAITAYATYQNNDYGNDYLYNVYGTGAMVYGHVGYMLPTAKPTKFQPYVSYASNTYDAVTYNRDILGVGVNAYFNGHNSKLTLEYKNEHTATTTGTVTLQAMIYL